MTKKAMLEDLARSGLTEADAGKMGLAVLTAEQTAKNYYYKSPSYSIPYHSPTGAKTKFCRVRFLSKVISKSTKKQIRYTQPRDSGCHLYFPPIFKWDTVLKDPTKMIAITEGEKKAAAGCKQGLPTIGLGGVWSFRSKAEGKLLIDDFDHFTWEERKVLIIFDSDLKDNLNVAHALNALAQQLTSRGAKVVYCYLPAAEDGEKQGLDDYLLNRPLSELFAEELSVYEESFALWRMNEEVAFIRDSNLYYVEAVGKQFNRATLLQGEFASRSHVIQVNDEAKLVNTFKVWSEWPHRRTHKALTYAPGVAEVTEANELNMWKGWGVQPKKGDIQPFNDLLTFIFKDSLAMKQWFIQWLAYPLQNPGTKLFSCVLIHGLTHGTGKSFVGYIMGDIYGSNFSAVGQGDIHGNYNQWQLNKQFILGEEITGSDKRTDSDNLKRIISQEKVFVNVKYQPIMELADCANYLFTSNHPDSFFLEDTDRRTAVHEVTGGPAPMEFYNEVDAWRQAGGAAHLFYHLLHEVDVSTFNPRSAAPFSEAKQAMINLSRSDLDMFALDLQMDPDNVLVASGAKLARDLYTAQELVAIYDSGEGRKTTAIAMSKALRRAGFVQLPMTATKTGMKRLWAVRNVQHWQRQGHKERQAGYDAPVIAQVAPPKVVSITKGATK